VAAATTGVSGADTIFDLVHHASLEAPGHELHMKCRGKHGAHFSDWTEDAVTVTMCPMTKKRKLSVTPDPVWNSDDDEKSGVDATVAYSYNNINNNNNNNMEAWGERSITIDANADGQDLNSTRGGVTNDQEGIVIHDELCEKDYVVRRLVETDAGGIVDQDDAAFHELAELNRKTDDLKPAAVPR